MKNEITYTTYFGCSGELSSKGDAVEFVQPWYTPISATPENTGMAVGGIGNTFTLTPTGETPNFSFIPGIFIDCHDTGVHFNDFYISVMEELTLDDLEISDVVKLNNHLKFYPAILDGEIPSSLSDIEILDKIKSALNNGRFLSDNKSNFNRWKIEFSPRAKVAIQKNSSCLRTQILVALDFFNGLLVHKSVIARSLTVGHDKVTPAYRGDQVQYKALYPVAQYQYSDLNGVNIIRKVVSPVVKNNKKLCSLPLHWNHFELVNNSSQKQLVTLVQPLKNLIGANYRKGRDGVQDSACYLTENPILQSHKEINLELGQTDFKGVSLTSDSPYSSDVEGEVIYGVLADKNYTDSGKVSVTVKESVYSSKVEDQIIAALKTGRTNAHFDHGIYSGREALSALVCVQVELEPEEQIELRFAQVMDHSKIQLDKWQSEKSYKNYFRTPHCAEQILEQTLPEVPEIEEAIIRQQDQFLIEAKRQFDQQESAERYATMAMNTLSFLSESTVWDIEDKFLVKECVDYPFFNSLDVYFYGSFSLLYLLPELDGAVMKKFADAILASDLTQRRYWEYEDKPNAELHDAKYQGIRAVKGAVIHDLGSPYDSEPDAYSWHNVKEWKDLAPKYILMVYRHFEKTGDKSVVTACWPAIKESLDYLSCLIEEGDSLPLTRGTDDTFDNLSSHGISIYCASLWCAGLRAAAELAKIMTESRLAEEYLSRLEDALQVLERALWDEQKGYYHFYATPVQASHLTGKEIWAFECLGLQLTGNPVVDKDILNEYLDHTEPESGLSKLEQRTLKKQKLIDVAPNVFSDSFKSLVADSDNSFGDALLANSYLKLVGLDSLFSEERTGRTLDYVYRYNFLLNSPKLGVANMTLSDGSPHEAFQAQDVWVGVQFSVATALKLAGKKAEAEQLLDTVYRSLYGYAKIPFAAPEGFNCSVTVTSESLMDEFGISAEESDNWLEALKKHSCLLSDGRVNPHLTNCYSEFEHLLADELHFPELAKLHKWLQSTGLKYTAARYFRPGMIFAYVYG